MSSFWGPPQPKEILVHKAVMDDPVTQNILSHCEGIPVIEVDTGDSKILVSKSKILNDEKFYSNTKSKILGSTLAGKHVIFISPAQQAVDHFSMPDDRMLCPHFDKVLFALNGCFYQCDWCYLKLTYRAQRPYITVKTQYEKIKNQLEKRLQKTTRPIFFNSGEMADSLALEHLTGAGKEFIPWFGQSENGRLFMLTKSDNVDGILDLEHNQKTVIAWSINNAEISARYEIGAPPFRKRLNAAERVQKAGYPIRMRLDPIVPVKGWQKLYAKTVKQIFERVTPEIMTLGTLRFEAGFYTQRNTIFQTGSDLANEISGMTPMFNNRFFPGSKNPKGGKYSYSEEKRIEIFNFVIDEIKKYSDCKIALCKESAKVWEKTGLNASIRGFNP